MWRRRRRPDKDFAEEIRANIALEADRLIASGMKPDQARAAAHRAFGNVARAQERFFESRRFIWLENLRQDLRYAFRTLRRAPGFTATAVLTLALGIGVNTAIFSACDALLLRPLPYADAGRLVSLRSLHRSAETPDSAGQTSPLDLADWQSQATSFEAITGYRWRTVDLRGGAYSERLRGLAVTPNFFDVFGVSPIDGRAFKAADQGTSTIVLGRSVWERRFSSDRSIIGSTLDVNVIDLSRAGATPHVVLGVASPQVHFPPLIEGDLNLGANDVDARIVDDRIDFWLPLFLGQDRRRDDRTLDVAAKLRPGVTPAHAQAEMDAIARHLADAFPATNRDWRVEVVPMRARIAGGAARVVLLLSLGTALVLLIACGNVSTLLLVRGLARQREVAVRSALGASRTRIAMQFLIESALVALAAAAIGVGIASAGMKLLASWLPPGVPLIHDAGINGTVLAFVAAVAAATACGTGSVPAWMSSAPSSGNLGARGMSTGPRQHRAIGALVTIQVALTIVLLVSTGLLLRSASRLWNVKPGFTASNVLTLTISLPNNKFDWQHNVVFSRDVVSAVTADRTVRDAAVIMGVPMRPGSFWTTFTVEGTPPAPGDDLPVARMRVIGPGYFRVMRIPLVDGRDFDERDQIGERGHPKTVLVSRALADRYWPGESAVGKRLRAGWADVWSTVVGVVGDVRYAGLDTPPDLEIYLADGLFPQGAITLLVKTTTNPMTAAAGVRARIAQVDREAFVTDVVSMDDLVAESAASRWFATLLLTMCAGVALLLALSGIYGIVAQAAVQRRLEIGIRIALGATPARVVALMLRRATTPVLAGSALGLLGAILTTRLVSTMLFGIAPFDPFTFAAATALFACVALVAAVLPARRATRVDPLIAMRSE